jgi:hypothetical protein
MIAPDQAESRAHLLPRRGGVVVVDRGGGFLPADRAVLAVRLLRGPDDRFGAAQTTGEPSLNRSKLH